jgi:hypothetical protein
MGDRDADLCRIDLCVPTQLLLDEPLDIYI